MRRPPYRDPLSILGWGVALASILAYWFYFVRTPIPGPGEEVARFTAVEGRVRHKPHASEAWAEAALSDRLRVGDVVQTERRSGAEIFFDRSNNLVRVRPDSIVSIGGSAESSTAAWRVQSGHIGFSVGEERTEIVTPTVRTVASRSATGDIDVGEGGETGVKIFSGEALLETTQGDRVSLGQNEAVQVTSAGKAGAKVALPAPPTLVSPAGHAELPFVPPPAATTTLVWEAVADGTTYHVAVDFNITQANLLLSAALDAEGVAGTSHALHALDPGRYFWRVAAVNKEGVEGAYSRLSLFRVTPPPEPRPTSSPEGPPPLLLVEPIEALGDVLHVRGRTLPGASVTVDGHAIPLRPDGAFSEYVRRRGRSELVVQATAPDGRTSEQTRPVPKGP